MARATYGAGWRLPAIALENSIAQTLTEHLTALSASGRLLKLPTPQGLETLSAKIADLKGRLRDDPAIALETLAQRIDIAPGQVQIKISPGGLSHLMDVAINEIDESHLSVSSPFTIRRRGIEAKIVTGAEQTNIDSVLLREVARAISWREQIEDGRTPKDIADELGWSTAPLRKRIKLACLSPALIEKILEGKQLPDQSVNALIHTDIPMSWADQERRFSL